MASRVNFSGLVIAGIGFFATRFTVTPGVYDDPYRFALAGVFPLALGLGLAAFGVALTVADVEAWYVRTITLWCMIGTGAILSLVLVTVLGSTLELSAGGASTDSWTIFSNVIIGGAVGGTLTGLYAASNRRQQRALRQQADRLETLNRLLRHEVLNAVTVIKGFTVTDDIPTDEVSAAISEESSAIERTIQEVKRLTNVPGQDRGRTRQVNLKSRLDASVETIRETYPSAEIDLELPDEELWVRTDEYVEDVFVQLLENAIEYDGTETPSVSVRVTVARNVARISVRDEGPGLPETQQHLLETGEIQRYDDPDSGFGLNLVRLLVKGYEGSIETTVDETGSTITVVLPRGDNSDIGVEASQSSLAGVRPATPQLVVVVAASLLAAVAYGIVSEELGGSIAAIGVFYGADHPIIGWITHEFHSIVFGFVFAGLVSLTPARYRESIWTYVAIGLGWSVVLWTVAAGFVAPAWRLLLGLEATIPTFLDYLLWSHLAWGVTLAVTTWLGYRYVTPRLVRIGGWIDRIEDRLALG